MKNGWIRISNGSIQYYKIKTTQQKDALKKIGRQENESNT